MAHELTTSDLIDEVKRRASVPTNQSLFQTADFEAFLNDELFNRVVPLIMRTREEYFVNSVDESFVANQSDYKVPNQAIGGKLRDIWLVDSGGNVENIPRLTPEEVSLNYYSNYQGYGFYMKGNNIVIHPTPTTTDRSIRKFYYRRPNNLTSTLGAKVTNVNIGLNEVTVDSAPSSWVAGTTQVDVQGHDSNFELILESQLISVKSGNVITLPDVSTISVGDYIATEDYSVVPMIPAEGFRLLAQAAANRCLEALGDHDAVAVGEKKYEKMEKSFLDTITPRIDGAPKKIVSTSGVFNRSRINTNNWGT